MTSITTNERTALFDVVSADWLIRLPVAATFVTHGLSKFPIIAAGAEMMGLPFIVWLAVALGEVGAGLALVAGGAWRGFAGDVLTRLGGAGAAAIMVGAIALVHWGQWSNIPSETHPFGGMEFQTLLLATGVFFALRGNRA